MYEESLRMPFLVRWPAAIRAGTRSDAIALNVDFAPTLLDAAGLPVPADMQGRSLVPLWRNHTPPDWRTSMAYRYYHDPGDHNTRAHYGVRTRTHKLIYFWKKEQWELFDLVKDPLELHNLYGQPGQEQLTASCEDRAAPAEKGAWETKISSRTSSCPTASMVPSRGCVGNERRGQGAALTRTTTARELLVSNVSVTCTPPSATAIT